MKQPTAIQQLKALYIAHKAATKDWIPEYALCSYDFTDRTANGLTKCIVWYITLLGGWATRVSTTGRQIPGPKHKGNPTGMKWIPGTTKRGTPDIMGTLWGHSLFIEVKIGRDRQSEAQRKVEADTVRAGGLYYVARDFASFKQWIDSYQPGQVEADHNDVNDENNRTATNHNG